MGRSGQGVRRNGELSQLKKVVVLAKAGTTGISATELCAWTAPQLQSMIC